MHDNTLCHASRETKEWLKRKNITVFWLATVFTRFKFHRKLKGNVFEHRLLGGEATQYIENLEVSVKNNKITSKLTNIHTK